MEQQNLALETSLRVDRMVQALADWFAEVDAELCSIDEPGKLRIRPLRHS